MVALDQKIIRYLTELSRIKCTPSEEEELLGDLQKILGHVDQLSEIDTEGVAPCNHVLEGFSNVSRVDEIGPTLPREVFLSNAPSQIGGLIRVPTVIKRG